MNMQTKVNNIISKDTETVKANNFTAVLEFIPEDYRSDAIRLFGIIPTAKNNRTAMIMLLEWLVGREHYAPISRGIVKYLRSTLRTVENGENEYA